MCNRRYEKGDEFTLNSFAVVPNGEAVIILVARLLVQSRSHCSCAPDKKVHGVLIISFSPYTERIRETRSLISTHKPSGLDGEIGAFYRS